MSKNNSSKTVAGGIAKRTRDAQVHTNKVLEARLSLSVVPVTVPVYRLSHASLDERTGRKARRGPPDRPPSAFWGYTSQSATFPRLAGLGRRTQTATQLGACEPGYFLRSQHLLATTRLGLGCLLRAFLSPRSTTVTRNAVRFVPQWTTLRRQARPLPPRAQPLLRSLGSTDSEICFCIAVELCGRRLQKDYSDFKYMRQAQRATISATLRFAVQICTLLGG